MALRAARESDGGDVAGEIAGGMGFSPGDSGMVPESSVLGWVPCRALRGAGVSGGVNCTGSENPRVGGSIPSLAIPIT